MKKIPIPIIIGIIAVIVIGIIYANMFIFESGSLVGDITPDEKKQIKNNSSLIHPEAITSGPLTITKYEHKINENIFFVVSGLKSNEKGNIRVFMPDGRLYVTYEYDGLVKDNFNLYFKPDTSFVRKICEQEELAGTWRVLFDRDTYPPLKFEIINEHLLGPDFRLTKSC